MTSLTIRTKWCLTTVFIKYSVPYSIILIADTMKDEVTAMKHVYVPQLKIMLGYVTH